MADITAQHNSHLVVLFSWAQQDHVSLMRTSSSGVVTILKMNAIIVAFS